MIMNTTRQSSVGIIGFSKDSKESTNVRCKKNYGQAHKRDLTEHNQAQNYNDMCA